MTKKMLNISPEHIKKLIHHKEITLYKIKKENNYSNNNRKKMKIKEILKIMNNKHNTNNLNKYKNINKTIEIYNIKITPQHPNIKMKAKYPMMIKLFIKNQNKTK